MMISLIVAYGKNYELGLNNNLLWRIPEDLKQFKKLTTNHHILMGRRTFESIGKPLPNRTNLILTQNGFDTSKYENTFAVNSFDEAVKIAEENGENELFIIGGAQIYNKFLDRAGVLYISEIDYEGEADSYLNPIDFGNYQLIHNDSYESTETTPKWKFKVWSKKD